MLFSKYDNLSMVLAGIIASQTNYLATVVCLPRRGKTLIPRGNFYPGEGGSSDTAMFCQGREIEVQNFCHVIPSRSESVVYVRASSSTEKEEG